SKLIGHQVPSLTISSARSIPLPPTRSLIAEPSSHRLPHAQATPRALPERLEIHESDARGLGHEHEVALLAPLGEIEDDLDRILRHRRGRQRPIPGVLEHRTVCEEEAGARLRED